MSLDGIGPVPNARILIERDAFSGEEIEVDGHVVDRDSRTYWIPSVAPRRTKTDSSHSRYQQAKSEYPPSRENQI